MTAKIIAPFGSWPSVLSAQELAGAKVRLGEVRAAGGAVHWLESRPSEGGRSVVVRRGPNGVLEDLLPVGFNARTRAHEYGGGSYAVDGEGGLWFCNFDDQRIWWRGPGLDAPQSLTPEADVSYADLQVDRAHSRLVCVREDRRGEGEPRSSLVAVPLAGGEPIDLVSGADFFASPALGPGGRELAWLEWSHPDMPWDGTVLRVAKVGDDGSLGEARRIAGGRGESIFQPRWAPDGALWFASDRSGWWNLHRATPRGDETATAIEAEVGLPQWVFGMSIYAFDDEGCVVFAACHAGEWRLHRLAEGRVEALDSPWSEIRDLQCADGRLYLVGGGWNRQTAVVSLEARSGAWRALSQPGDLPLPEQELSQPQAIEVPVSENAVTHAFFYPPANASHEGPAEERPPLVVLSHGGPTAAATTALNLDAQFWASRGFAVADVNYRGSTGFGRAYRTQLDGQWGVADVEDCCAVALHLAQLGEVDAGRLIIRGGSAGGYTTLAALAFRDVFQAGASYYGIGDLDALARDTHKFESRYLERLVGGAPQDDPELYVERSPIHSADRLSCPVIFLQGLEDRVVPPSQAETMVAALREKGVPVAYVAFEGEQHGFRRAENITRALESELAFYARVLGIERPEICPDLEIWHLDTGA
jgi:dipeptidyl aminopeptidase/acylaminoacyl peptidase